jgi:dTDP-D-glucose 4,6-dehydratase
MPWPASGLPVYGDGQQIRDWLYVRRPLQRQSGASWMPAVPGETYNVGGWQREGQSRNRPYGLRDCSTNCVRVPDGKPYREQISYVTDRPGHDRRYAIDARKIERELGWKTGGDLRHRHPQDRSQWYLENQDWVRQCPVRRLSCLGREELRRAPAMRILLFGKRGQVGWELQRSLAPLGQIVALDCEGQGNLCGDFTDLAGLVACVRAVAPDVIVNAAAHTAVDKAESEPELARTINALAPGILAEEADRLGAWLVHYSTDYVFDGSGDTPWRESDPTGPLGVYGKTKLAGEQAVARCQRHLLFRTSWVYAARGNNFARTMLRLACERERPAGRR